MAEKDITEKRLEEYSDVFADIVNVLLFDGEEIVKPEELTDALTSSSYQSKNQKVKNLERDVAKIWKPGNICLAYIGLENQTDINKYMPLRVMGYDGTVYRDELNKLEMEEENKTPQLELYPVLTLVLYFGYKRHWTASTRLKECFSVPSQFDRYVNDYKLNLFEIAWLPEETINKFKSDFKLVAEYFNQIRNTGRWEPMPSKVKHVKELLELFKALTKDNRFLKVFESEEEITMASEALDYVENRGYERGKAEGIAEGKAEGIAEGKAEMLINSIRNLMKTLNLTVKQAMDALQIPIEEQKKYASMI